MRPILALAALGALLAALLVALGPTSSSTYAQGLPPRPPTPTPTTTPTAEPEPDPPPAPGTITGTVIDLNSGAPMPNVAVRVGDLIVISDADGNYGRAYLPPGSYEVALALPADWGSPAQATLTVAVSSGQTTVQHLFFRRAAP